MITVNIDYMQDNGFPLGFPPFRYLSLRTFCRYGIIPIRIINLYVDQNLFHEHQLVYFLNIYILE